MWKMITALIERWGHCLFGIMAKEWHLEVDVHNKDKRRTCIACSCGKVFWEKGDK